VVRRPRRPRQPGPPAPIRASVPERLPPPLVAFPAPNRVLFFKGFRRPLEKKPCKNAPTEKMYTTAPLASHSPIRIYNASDPLTRAHQSLYNPFRVGGLRQRPRVCGRPVALSLRTTRLDTGQRSKRQYARMPTPCRRHTDVEPLTPCPGGLGRAIRNRGRQRCLTNGELEPFSHNPRTPGEPPVTTAPSTATVSVTPDRPTEKPPSPNVSYVRSTCHPKPRFTANHHL